MSLYNGQVAIDAASIPNDAKIAVLEKTSAESEKRIAGDLTRFFAESEHFYFIHVIGRYLHCTVHNFLTVIRLA